MSFQPVVPLAGYSGWKFLQRTQEKQQAAYSANSASQRDEIYFRDNIGSITTAADLVKDRRLLRVALTAFGLEEDLPNKAFIQKVMESATLDPSSLVNRLTDDRYKQLSKAFGFSSDMLPLTQNTGFADRILRAYRERDFEKAVGEQDETMRLALSFDRDIARIADMTASDVTKWYKVLGTPNLRAVFETAFNLPSSFGSIDIDKQVEIFRARTEKLTGESSVSQFSKSQPREALTKRFFLMGQLNEGASFNGASAALTLLQSGQASLRGLLG